MVKKSSPDLPEFGRYLSTLRKNLGIKSQRQTASINERLLQTERKGIAPISYSQVNADERGLIADISPARLRAYAVLYKVPYAEIVTHLVREKYGVDLVPADGSCPKTIKDVVPQENAPFLEELNRLLSGEERRRIVSCFNGMLEAFSSPNSPGRATTQEEAEEEKKVGAA